MKIVETDNLMFPLYVLETGDDMGGVPNGAYVLGRNGLCLHSKGEELSSVKRVECRTLPQVEDMARYTGRKVDAGTLALAQAFFQLVYNERRTEAEALLYREGETWWLRIPKQRTTATYLRYDSLGEGDLWYRAGAASPAPAEDAVVPYGTIHSHASMPAFFSGTDDNDHRQMPGLHLVMGKFTVTDMKPGEAATLALPEARMEARVCGDGVLKSVPVADVCERGLATVVAPVLPEGHVSDFTWGLGGWGDRDARLQRDTILCDRHPRPVRLPRRPPRAAGEGGDPFEEMGGHLQAIADAMAGVLERYIDLVYLAPMCVEDMPELTDVLVDQADTVREAYDNIMDALYDIGWDEPCDDALDATWDQVFGWEDDGEEEDEEEEGYRERKEVPHDQP